MCHKLNITLKVLLTLVITQVVITVCESGEDWIPRTIQNPQPETSKAFTLEPGNSGTGNEPQDSKSGRSGRDWTTSGGSTGSYYPPTNAYVGGPSYLDSYGVPHTEYTYPNAASSASYPPEEIKAKQRPIQVPPVFPPVYSGMSMTPAECQMAGYSNFLSDILRVGGIVKVGLIKAGLTALAAGLLTKLPILLFIKTLIVKLIIFPIGFIIFSLPVLLPLLLFFLPNLLKDKPPIMMMMSPDSGNSTNGGGNKKPVTRDYIYRIGEKSDDDAESEEYSRQMRNSSYFDKILSNLFDSQFCLQRIACQLGVRDADSKYRKSVSWALKYLQTFKIAENNPELQTRLKSYRNAYDIGATKNSTDFCTSNENFPCEPPHLVIQQSKRSFTLI